MKLYCISLVVVGLQVLTTSGQTVLREQIWSTVIYSRYGDRTPYILPKANTLTALGANQMYNSGSMFRDRYLTGSSDSRTTAIQGISASQLDNDQVSVLSLGDQFVVASAQAFMQGLYPPLQSSSDVASVNGQSQLANGSSIGSPLGGYQYPQITTASPRDPDSIWLMGTNNCPAFQKSSIKLLNSESTQNLLNTTLGFYESLLPALPDANSLSVNVNYLNAYLIFDFLNYASIHNASVLENVSLKDLTKAKSLADSLVSNLYGGTSTSEVVNRDNILTIAGQTFANAIGQALHSNIRSLGSLNKMTLLFGGFEPMISFAALARLALNDDSPFLGVREYGSSMVFELFSLSENDTDPFPSTADLKVRFFFRNATDDGPELTAYPLFGNGPSRTTMELNEFDKEMRNIMVSSTADWCKTCASYGTFCPSVDKYGHGDEIAGGVPRISNRPNRVVSGVIGALVSIAVIGILAAGAIVFGGVRFYRKETKRRSDLNGFKGGEKLSSDQDLTLPKHEVSGVVTTAETTAPAAHERVGSWELTDQKRAEESRLAGLESATSPAKRESFEHEDLHVTPFADPVEPHDRV